MVSSSALGAGVMVSEERTTSGETVDDFVSADISCASIFRLNAATAISDKIIVFMAVMLKFACMTGSYFKMLQPIFNIFSGE